MTAPADAARVVLHTRVDCHLCAEARAVVGRVCADIGEPWVEVDVDSDPELQAEYGDRVPVVVVDDVDHAWYEVDPDRLRQALTG
ncbi:glutaredoxin family protein [Nakamurella leprariae]|uniref:Glutaredoxin family protein n=1 Tax=Nakamurella leprariae TaxID=2803911 RepID=A0A939C0L9_9ACTN|nr:glutaredoxin family protein [Nakamurella leprariae]MBM9466287.1 glutaredoxin family protein [Nakamurella leprariae]